MSNPQETETTYLIDCCATQAGYNILEFFDEALYARRSVDGSGIYDSIGRICRMNEFSKKHKITTIPQVIEECFTYIDLFRAKLNLFERKYKESSMVDSLHQFIKMYSNFINYLHGSIINPKSFGEIQRVIHKYAFHFSKVHKKHEHDGRTLGDRLKTDRNLIATGIAIGVECPSVLISNDFALIESFHQVAPQVIKDMDAHENMRHCLQTILTKRYESDFSRLEARTAYTPKMSPEVL